ncbi:hypothetical protein C8J30_101119 [Rhodobacter viridis]|uniref:Uncharacterized protein n=1 Tax=Rhodobacter viridis TaxID=1054202 RepID=A0A318U2N5_9RHOB|nr:hypothetical protein [Rhodobacter viridis]PYF12738.1 hypothetical protein C8J30_101119 [Rhodobacter viridis]
MAEPNWDTHLPLRPVAQPSETRQSFACPARTAGDQLRLALSAPGNMLWFVDETDAQTPGEPMASRAVPSLGRIA